MLYWRELGPQSGQYSINIGVKVSIKFTFSSIDTTHIVYIYMIKRPARRPFLHTCFVLFFGKRAVNVKTNFCSPKPFQVSFIDREHNYYYLHDNSSSVHVKCNDALLMNFSLRAFFLYHSAGQMSIYTIIIRKNCINDLASHTGKIYFFFKRIFNI